VTPETRIEALEERIGYRFADRAHPGRALTRLAYAAEQHLRDDQDMDALATLGDAVIDLLVIDDLLRGGVTRKGEITVSKVRVVNMSVLRAVAESLDLAPLVLWGKGEEAQQVWISGRVLAECCEAVVGAVFLDGGLIAAEEVLRKLGLIRRES
jgi:ribonuclease III